MADDPSALPAAPEPADFLSSLDAGGTDAADLDAPVAPDGHPDEYDHDLDGPVPGGVPPQPAAAAPAPVAPKPPEPEPPKMVPVAELVTERAKRQELQRRVEELEAKRQPEPPKEPEPAPEPDVDYLEDPKGYVDQQVKRAIAALQKPVDQARTTAEQARQVSEQQQAFQQLTQTLNAAEAGFSAQHPDYNDALRFSRELRLSELKVFMPEADEQQLITQVRVEELRGAVAMLQAGRNPAEVAYQYAIARGYRKAEPAPAPNGAPATPSPEEQERLRQQARGLPIGSGPGDLQPGSEQSNVMPEFTAALRERFGSRR